MARRLVAFLCTAIALSLIPGEIPASDPTLAIVQDPVTGLKWVADGTFLSEGMSTGAGPASRVEALRLIAAMNSGTMSNAGHNDWRLPTWRELQRLYQIQSSGNLANEFENQGPFRTWMERRNLPGGWVTRQTRTGTASDETYPWPVRSATVPPGFGDASVVATNSAFVEQGGEIASGNLVVNDQSPGPTLGQGELTIGLSTVVGDGTTTVQAHYIKVKSSGFVNADVYYNQLDNNGTIAGSLFTPLSLPVFSTLPPFVMQAPAPGAPDIVVNSGESTVLFPGDYGLIKVKQNGIVRFSGGVYNVREIDFGTDTQFLLDAASEVRVAEKFAVDQDSFVGSDTGVGASEIIFYIAGVNGSSGNLGATPKAAKIGVGCTVNANFYVPNGTLLMRQNSVVTGAFVARDVDVGHSVHVALDSFWKNLPPIPGDDSFVVGEGFEASLLDSEEVSLLANDTDPEGGVLTMTTTPVVAPLHGSLTLNPDGTFLYVHDGSETTDDSFVYEVCDDGSPSLCANATVSILVVPVNDPPTPVDDSLNVFEGSVGAPGFSVLDNDSDPEGDPLMVPGGIGLRGAHGVASIQPDGTFTYTHSGDEGTFDTILYDVCDSEPACATAVLNINIIPVNDPPTANPQIVQFPGQAGEDGGGGSATSIQIVVTGSDPEGDPLLFSIDSGPSGGTIAQLSNDTFEYTPVDPSQDDSFVFVADDQHGGLDYATVTVLGAPGVPIATINAIDSSAEVARNTPLTVSFSGDSPDASDLSFSVLSGPGNGTLSALVPGTESPVRSASAVYTPADGFSGSDTIVFEVCGDVGGASSCDQGQMSLVVLGAVVNDQEVSTFNDRPLLIDLSGAPIPGEDSGGSSSPPPDPRAQVRPNLPGGIKKASTLVPVRVAGNVSDSNGDGFGDEANDLPGTSPTLVSAGVDQTGGPGTNGTVRIHMEWALADLPSLGATDRVMVQVHTVKGTTDSLDTFFYAGGTNSDSLLSAFDYQTPNLGILPDVVMQVDPNAPVGTEDTFSFDITDRLQSILAGSFLTHLVIQARVDESLAGAGAVNGLQIRSSENSNVTQGLEPQLVITPIDYAVASLPTHGSLTDSLGQPVVVAQSLPSRLITYTPDPGYTGPDSFTFQGSLGTVTESGEVSITVKVGTCADDPSFCDSGRGS